jgi:protein-glutamine gamma-glutamyltransferase
VAGFVSSWYRRDNANVGLKIFLSFALLFVTTYFFYIMVAEPYDTRVPLAELFLWIQVLHSFDLPARRDLYFSLAAALVLISMAGTLALDVSFIAYLAVFMVFSLAAMAAMHVSELGLKPRTLLREMPPGRTFAGIGLLTLILLTLLAGIYVVTPRLPGMRVQSLPFSAEKALQAAFRGGVLGGNPVNLAERLPMSRATFSGKAYPGFNEALDLRVRGRLSRDLMMRVKSTDPVYHRAQVFDTYTGKGWKQSGGRPKKAVQTGRPPIVVPQLDIEGAVGARETIASYYIEAAQPNIVFAPYEVALLYFPAAAVWQDKDSALTSSFSLESGVVYSTVSHYDPPNPVRLKKIPAVYKNRPLQSYLALPGLPARDFRYAAQITAGKEMPYDKLVAIQTAVQKRCGYSLDAPFQREDQDAVDFFLFTSRRGSCDQFASAFVVLARLNGIPTRLVTGYAPGDYNPLTGYWEVRAEHAHSWAEAYFPNYGWIAFDPTPGFALPDAGARNADPFVIERLAAYFQANYGAQLRVARAFFTTLRSAMFGLYGIIAMAVAAAILLIMLTRGYRRRAANRPAPPAIPSGPVAVAYHAMLAALAGAGYVRIASQTPEEFAEAQSGAAWSSDARLLTALFEKTFYGLQPVTKTQADQARHHLDSVRNKLKERRG